MVKDDSLRPLAAKFGLGSYFIGSCSDRRSMSQQPNLCKIIVAAVVHEHVAQEAQYVLART